MNRERLQLMVTMLREVEAGTWKPTILEPFKQWASPVPEGVTPANAFDMSTWAEEAGYHCGFSACAVGHACFDERFTSQGLALDWGAPEFEGERDFDAVQEFFGISFLQAFEFFSPAEYCVKPGEVADRIEKYLEERA